MDPLAHEGAVASLLGLRGITGVAESVMVERDISMAELIGGRFHVAHMSARQSLRGESDPPDPTFGAFGIALGLLLTPH